MGAVNLEQLTHLSDLLDPIAQTAVSYAAMRRASVFRSCHEILLEISR
jgi:hypothetical protein